MADCTIQGVFTDVGRIALAQSILGPLVQPPYASTYMKYFKIGEGGYIVGGGGSKSPKTPDPTRTDLESESDSTLYTFQKDFIAADLSYVMESGIPYAVIRVFLDYGDANDDGSGGSPEFFEIGLFDENDVMLVYATIPGETKNASKTLNHTIRVSF